MKRFLAGILFLTTVACAQQAGLTNADIIKMETAGMSDNVIIGAINGSPAAYDTSADGLIALKSAKVSDAVMAALMARQMNTKAAVSNTAGSNLPPNGPPAGVDEIGVYYQDSSNVWHLIPSEIVNYKSGGVLKSTFSYGIVKQDKNGHIEGPKSKTQIASVTSVLVYARDGDSGDDYLVLKLRENSDNREFRSVTGGVFHESTGAKRDNIPVTVTRIAPRVYELKFPAALAAGEYGVIPPGAVSTTNAASGGKVYTFGVKE